VSAELKVGIIGAGYWGPNLVRNFSEAPGADVAAVADLDPERLGALHKRFPAVRTTTRYRELLDDPAIGAICVVTPISTHRALAEEAFAAGKHVFVEKPLAITWEQLDQVQQILEAQPDGPTVLDTMIAAMVGRGPAAHRVWLPPLAAAPALDQVLGVPAVRPGRGLAVPMSGGTLQVPVGVIDRPYLQRRDPLTIDLANGAGHLAVVGGPRAGKSGAVRAVVLALDADVDQGVGRARRGDAGVAEELVRERLAHQRGVHRVVVQVDAGDAGPRGLGVVAVEVELERFLEALAGHVGAVALVADADVAQFDTGRSGHGRGDRHDRTLPCLREEGN